MKYTISLIVCLLISNLAFSQDYYSQYIYLFQKQYDAKKIKNLLQEWKQKDANDIKYYIAGFNFYLKESKKEIVRLDTKEGREKNFVIKDSINNTVGYLYSETVHIDSLFSISQNFLNQGIALFPKRLDLRFGKIYTLGETKKYNVFTDEILNVIHLTDTNHFEWLWDGDKALEDPINFFKNAIQDYENTLFNANENSNLKKIALEMNRLFPDDPIAMSTLGSSYLLEGNNQEALRLFLLAYKINPEDTIVMNNLGETYSRLKDNVNAKKYYSLMIAKGDEETKKYAEAKLKKLEENLINKK